MKSFLPFTALLIFTSLVMAQTPATRIDSFDVAHYNLNLNITAASQSISGNAIITGKMRYPSTKILALDLLKLSVQQVNANNIACSFYQNDSVLHIVLNQTYQKDDSITVNIQYQGNPSSDQSWGGFYHNGNVAFNMGVAFT